MNFDLMPSNNGTSSNCLKLGDCGFFTFQMCLISLHHPPLNHSTYSCLQSFHLIFVVSNMFKLFSNASPRKSSSNHRLEVSYHWLRFLSIGQFITDISPFQSSPDCCLEFFDAMFVPLNS